MGYENPFTPVFGEMPAVIAGRQSVISDITRAFKSETRRPELSSIISGARGTGKTTLLSYLALQAEESGWISISTTAQPGMLEDLEVQARRKTAHLIDNSPHTRVSKVGIPQVLELATMEAEVPSNWRSRMEDILVQLQDANTGLFITVDEIDPQLDEMVTLTTVFQHFVRENRKVGLLMAGLPGKISSLLLDKTVSFLRRSHIVTLERIANQDIKIAFQKTVFDNERSIEDDALALAVDAIDGFPFLMQLVGYRSWEAHNNARAISADDVRQGIALARADMETRILEPTYRELSNGDIAFLEAMLEDEGDSSIADISTRLGKSSSFVSQYRSRLIDAGVIGMRRRGIVGFELPFFRDYLADMLSE